MEKLMYPFMTRVLLPEEGGGYLIEFPDLPGCMSDGETLQEAIENGQDALQCWIEAAAEDGQEIPEPGSSPTWVQQVPTDVHIQLSKRAAAEGMSLSETRCLDIGSSHRRSRKRMTSGKAQDPSITPKSVASPHVSPAPLKRVIAVFSCSVSPQADASLSCSAYASVMYGRTARRCPICSIVNPSSKAVKSAVLFL